jgi:glycosyltransferase involved in cell wall biosynthesis
MLIERGHVPATLAALLPDGEIHFWNRLRSKLPPWPRCPADRSMGYLAFRSWDALSCADEVVSSFRPDIVIAHGPPPLRAAQIFCDMGVPTLVYFHGVDLEKQHLPKSDLASYIANSSFTSDRIFRQRGISPVVIPPITRLSNYICQRQPSAITLVNPIPAKGVDTAIAIAKARPDISFLFVKAWQSLYQEENRRIDQLSSQVSNIRVLDPVRDMRSVYRHTKILLMPSVCEETWGRTAVEAQTSGIPVVARSIGGLPESVGSGGVLIPQDAPISEWINAISRLWDSEVEYLTASRSALANAKVIEDRIGKAFDRLLEICEHHVRTCGGQMSRLDAGRLSGPGRQHVPHEAQGEFLGPVRSPKSHP